MYASPYKDKNILHLAFERKDNSQSQEYISMFLDFISKYMSYICIYNSDFIVENKNIVYEFENIDELLNNETNEYKLKSDVKRNLNPKYEYEGYMSRTFKINLFRIKDGWELSPILKNKQIYENDDAYEYYTSLTISPTICLLFQQSQFDNW